MHHQGEGDEMFGKNFLRGFCEKKILNARFPIGLREGG